MQSRKVFLAPFSGTAILAVPVLLLILNIVFQPEIFANTKLSIERHILLEYFVTFIGLGLFFLFLRQYWINRINSFLFFSLGYFSFVVFKCCKLARRLGFTTYPGC